MMILPLSPPSRPLTEPYDAEGITPNPGTALGRLSHLFGPRKLLALSHHVSEPEGAAVKVQDEAHGRVRDLLDTVPRHVTHSNTQLSSSL